MTSLGLHWVIPSCLWGCGGHCPGNLLQQQKCSHLQNPLRVPTCLLLFQQGLHCSRHKVSWRGGILGSDRKSSKCKWVLRLDSMLLKSWMYWEGMCHTFMLWRCSLTVLGKAACMYRKRVAVTLLALQVSLILVVTKCMVSVVQQLGLPPN